MVFDVIVLLLLAVPMAIGLKKGLIYMSLQALGWIGALVVAFFITGPIASAMNEGFLGTMVADRLDERFSASADAVDTAARGIPGIISGGLEIDAQSVSEMFTSLLASLVVTVLVFIAIVVAVRLILRLLIRPVYRRHRGNVLNSFDRLIGGVAGLVEGILLVFIFLAALMPLMNVMGMGTADSIVSGLEQSLVAGSLYDSNLLLLVTGGFFS